MANSPVVLLILDGWGIAAAGPGNAIALAKLPYYQSLLSTYPRGIIQASGEAVGLPRGEDGNTETGHLNLGAGYIVYQDLPRINLAIADGSFFKNPAFIAAIEHARKYESNIHLLGLVGSGGVHSNVEHILALLQLFKEQSFPRVFLHLMTDGRDSPPRSAQLYFKQIEGYVKSLKFGTIATVMGRYYGMDRDNRWDRTQKAYDALTKGIGKTAESVHAAIASAYAEGITDEFIEPTVILSGGVPTARIAAHDSVIFFNFRIDRPRQLTKAFVLDQFDQQAGVSDFDPYAVKYFKKHTPPKESIEAPFPRGPKIEHLYFVTMTEYSPNVHASNVAFPPHVVETPLGGCISAAGKRQIRIAESEKERFVTYYFNGLREAPFAQEEWLIVPSPAVATYDQKPEMAAVELTDMLIERIGSQHYDFFVVNFANADMVAHTGMIPATITACETLDRCLSRIIPMVLQQDGTVIITADHGNAEEMIDPSTGGIDTEHSVNPVPLIVVRKDLEGKNILLRSGVLADITTTILPLMHLPIPKTMTGGNLLENVIK